VRMATTAILLSFSLRLEKTVSTAVSMNQQELFDAFKHRFYENDNHLFPNRGVLLVSVGASRYSWLNEQR
jgi:hypothetical protein